MSDVEDSTAQLFAANSDLYDAEIDSGDENVNKDGDENEDDFVIENGTDGDREERSDEDDPFPDSESDEGDTNEIKIKKPKKIRGTIQLSKEPKKRKSKKDDVQKLHSETQRLIRESNVKLPYHQPETKDITHFLQRVPVNNNNKLLKNNKPTKHENIEDTFGQSEKEIQSSHSENLTTAEDKSPSETTAEPKLTAASDPFFFHDNCNKQPAGLNHLMERFFKHNKSNIKETKLEEVTKGQTEKADVVQIIDEVEKLTTTNITESTAKTQKMRPIFQPGDNLRSLKEKLQVNMKLQRAEVRKIHESQRRIDNEEISDEEEEEEFEDEDSDFEVDEWNAEDERAQEERNEEAENGEEDENKDTSDIQSNEESNSITDSETNHKKTETTAQDHSKTQKPVYPDDQTMDLFPSDNSNQTANRTLDDDIEDNDRDSVVSEESIKLRLDSVDDSQDVFIDHHDDTSTRSFTKLKMPVNIYEQSSDGSNLPNAQPEKTGKNKMSEASTSNEGLTPLSRIQRLLGVDCSSVSSDRKSKPLSELTLPVEDSQDLYDADDVTDKRFSNGLNTSKDFNFALDEDTQFTQFVDSQGYLLSTAKKKGKSNDLKSNDMSELLGLCSGTFSDQPKKKSSLETQQNMSELLGLCSGKFCDAASQNLTTESQDNMNELLGLCSGKFPDEKKTKTETSSQNMSELLGLCSGKFEDENKSTSESQKMKELLDLCSDDFNNETKAGNTSETQNRSGRFELKSTFSFQSEAGQKGDENISQLLGLCSGGFSGVGSTKNSGNERSRESESGVFSELDQSEKRKPKSKQGLTATFEAMADEENNMDEVIALCSGKFPGTLESKEQTYELEDCKTSEKDEYEIEENSKNNSDVQEDSENEVFSDDEKQDTDYENMEEEDVVIKKSKKYGINYSKKVHSIFNKENFVEDEAELSGSEASSDEEDGSEDDELEEESDVEDLPSDEELQRQVNKVHLKSLIDEDKRELRELKERYLEDGDLYSEGGGRARNFKWQGLEDSQHDMFENKVLWGDDEIIDSALLSEAELERRKMKHERDQFLQEQLTRAGDTQPTDVDENSQTILNLINDTSNAGTDTKQDIPAMAAPTSKDSASTKLSQKRGSFLNRSKDQMTRLSSITATKKTPNTTRGFVFHTISPSSKTKEKTARKLQRSVSLSESPNPKRPRLDRTLSNIATGSLFAAMPV